jgi:hypothetical protein
MTAPGHGVGPGPRHERPTTPADEPNVTANDRGAPVQGGSQSPGDVAALPANAHGHDKQATHDQPRDDGSMYDGRPGEDKDRAETDMP